MPRSFMIRGGLQSMPVEIICLVLENLEMPDLLACSLVAKHLRKVVNESSRLQYTIELAKHRMVSLLPPATAPSFATRLKLIRDREMAWKQMKFKSRHMLRLPPTGSVYEFVGGIYGNGREDESRATASISFLELPSSDATLLGEPEHELDMWTHTMGDVMIIDFTMDPSQDLLVLVALAPPDSKCVYELHLRSIKTNLPHPKAPVSILSCLRQHAVQPQPSEIVAAVRVQVSGNLVALLIKEIFESAGAHLEIWNWENGSQYSSAMTRLSGIDDFTFLTRDSFLLVRPTGRFEVYTFIDPVNCHTAPVLRATYSFPPLSDGYMYWYISMSSNPAPGYVPHSQDSAPGSCRQIYYPRPDQRIHACCLYIFNPANEENPVVHSFVFFLNLKTLLNPPAEWLAKSPQHPGTNNVARWIVEPRAIDTEIDVFQDTSDLSSSPTSSTTAVDVPIHSPNSSPIAGPSYFPTTSIGIPVNSIAHNPIYPPFPSFDSHLPTMPLAISHQSQPFFMNDRHPPSAPPSASTSPTSSNSNAARCTLSSVREAIIPWEVWGPQSTRWFEECLNTDWQHAIYGLRTVESVHPNRHPGGSNFALNPTLQSPSSNGTNGVHIHSHTNGTQAHTDVNINSDTVPSTSTPASNGVAAVTSHQLVQNGNENIISGNDDDAGSGQWGGGGERSSSPKRYLRVRDFNPYAFKDAVVAERSPPGSSAADDASEDCCEYDGRRRSRSQSRDAKGKGKMRATNPNSSSASQDEWRTPRLVTGPSTTHVKGVFVQDIVSSLPYTEVISEGTYEVTDVMMDDCRLLLLKRGKAGKLKRVEVLML